MTQRGPPRDHALRAERGLLRLMAHQHQAMAIDGIGAIGSAERVQPAPSNGSRQGWSLLSIKRSLRALLHGRVHATKRRSAIIPRTTRTGLPSLLPPRQQAVQQVIDNGSKTANGEAGHSLQSTNSSAPPHGLYHARMWVTWEAGASCGVLIRGTAAAVTAAAAAAAAASTYHDSENHTS